ECKVIRGPGTGDERSGARNAVETGDGDEPRGRRPAEDRRGGVRRRRNGWGEGHRLSRRLEKMVVWTDGKKLFVDTTMKSGVPDHVATDTIKAYNAFLERATGLTAKERGKRAQQAAKKGSA